MIDTDPTAPFALLPPDPALTGPFRARLAAAFALLERGDAELAAEMRALLREIVLAVGPDDGDSLIFDGASSFMLWGCIVLNAASHPTRLAMVEALAHESAHNLLFGFAADGALVSDGGDERYASPLRADARPLDGIYHATFVCARMHRALTRLLAEGVLDAAEASCARERLGVHAEAFAKGLEVVRQHARLTPMGVAALAGARAHMEEARRTSSADPDRPLP
jgi:HEXXH motif-containing protein